MNTYGAVCFPRCAIVAFAAFSFLMFAGGAGAKQQAKPVSVFPAPGTPVASELTTFSFRGVEPGNLGPVKIYGSQTGRHLGKRLKHSDGKGASFIPNKPFAPGEKVNVFTKKRIKLTENGDFSIRIGKFLDSVVRQSRLVNDGASTSALAEALKSRPDLDVPDLEVLTNTPQASRGKIFFAPKTLPARTTVVKGDGAVIADNQGRIIWYRPGSTSVPGTMFYNFQPAKYKDRPVLTFYKFSPGASGQNLLEVPGSYGILNNKYQRIANFTPGNGYDAQLHEIALTERNTALVKANRTVEWDLTPVGGPENGKLLDNIVQEIDIASGAVIFEWHAIGSVGLKSTETTPPADGSAFDYAHVNAITADGDSILVSARRNSSILRINRSTAKVRWRLRGDGLKPSTNDFDVPEDARFGYQHDIQRLQNGDISVFDNGSHPGPPRFNALPVVRDQSSALVLRLSGKGQDRRASLVKRYDHPDKIVALTQGSARILANGNEFVGWGQVPRMTEFAPNGNVTWDATFGNGGFPLAQHSYRAFKAPWKGFPQASPAIASEAELGGDGATVYASWNGATNISRWSVYTGSAGDTLVKAASSEWDGLETVIPVPSVGDKIRVVAYAADGKKLGQSRLIKVGERSR